MLIIYIINRNTSEYVATSSHSLNVHLFHEASLAITIGINLRVELVLQ
jgi:hypothetical protein